MRAIAAASLLAILTVPNLFAQAVNPAIDDVKSRHEAALLARPGVVSVGIGRTSDGRPAIVVGVEPGAAVTLPREIEGVPVERITLQPPRAQ